MLVSHIGVFNSQFNDKLQFYASTTLNETQKCRFNLNCLYCLLENLFRPEQIPFCLFQSMFTRVNYILWRPSLTQSTIFCIYSENLPNTHQRQDYAWMWSPKIVEYFKSFLENSSNFINMNKIATDCGYVDDENHPSICQTMTFLEFARHWLHCSPQYEIK